MSDEPFLGEIQIFSFGFAPRGWALCNGQLLPINQNQALFSLLGTMYGGNGSTNFALPDLRGRVPLHRGNFTVGAVLGQEAHTVTQSEMPQHLHFVQATRDAATPGSPTGRVLAHSQGASLYGQATNLVAMAPQEITNVGGSQPHNNMMPYLVLSYCIALQGIFPSQN